MYYRESGNTLHSRIITGGLACLVITALAAVAASADNGQLTASVGQFGYSGEITKYATLQDALAGTNSVGVYDVTKKLSSLCVIGSESSNSPSKAEAIWYGIDDGNFNNTSSGYLQLCGETPSGTTSLTGGWTSSRYDTFAISLTGANALNTNTITSLINSVANGSCPAVAGQFDSYKLQLTAGGITNAHLDASSGLVESFSSPTTIKGTFTGVFTAQSADNSTGYYVLDFNLAKNSVTTNGGLFVPRVNAPVFGTTSQVVFRAPVPEPAYFQLGLLLLGGGLIRFRRRPAYK